MSTAAETITLVSQELESQSLNAIVAGFSFAAALSWMDLVRWLVNQVVKVNKNGGRTTPSRRCSPLCCPSWSTSASLVCRLVSKSQRNQSTRSLVKIVSWIPKASRLRPILSKRWIQKHPISAHPQIRVCTQVAGVNNPVLF